MLSRLLTTSLYTPRTPLLRSKPTSLLPQRSVLPEAVFRSSARSYASSSHGLSSLPTPPQLASLSSEEDHTAASIWLDAFRALSTGGGGPARFPREVGELSFSRSSGPGGQNVNKVNTKATLRCGLAQAWIPKWAVPALKRDPHYVASTHSILVTATVHRSQDQNIEECLKKLHGIISTAAASCIQRGPSEEQKKKVEGLVKADKARRKADKMARSSVKQARRGGGAFDY